MNFNVVRIGVATMHGVQCITVAPESFVQALYDELDLAMEGVVLTQEDRGEEIFDYIAVGGCTAKDAESHIRDAMNKFGFSFKRNVGCDMHFEVEPTPQRNAKRRKKLCTVKSDPNKNSIAIYGDNGTVRMIPRASILYVCGKPKKQFELHLTNGSTLYFNTRLQSDQVVRLLYACDTKPAVQIEGPINVSLDEKIEAEISGTLDVAVINDVSAIVSGELTVDGDVGISTLQSIQVETV